ncbi:carbohydrate-binding family 9-like protein [Labilibaculum sp. DW002]|uniref:Carbohydrate-binding family 9-like protein n=1 Tax=Paralabilibaculum antarcticum TaxID=2912572 RepID=A0ABT5VP32_9BACT|nr:carbohydrate-binding family 9-like protein [Labilibaculum sp. DW002]MDE5417190.1 carbohydrate-binding family 9-like protein [Labilibaculum sp. DW002]
MKILVCFAILFSSVIELFAQDNPKSYVCYKTDEIINVDGELNDSEWGKFKWSDSFVDIEGDKKPLPTYETKVKMAWDEDYFYIAAKLEEPHIWAKLKQRDTVIFYDNDFEVFIDPQGDNHQYYEFELNALNTIWDLMLVKPYRDGAPAINAWDIKGLKSAVKVYGSLNDPSDTDQYWTIEIAFPWEVLKECAFEGRGPKDGEQWRVNFSRVNWDVEILKGIYKKCVNPETGKTLPEHNWVWSPQGVVAMHQPETWGYVQFSDVKVGESIMEYQKDIDYDLKKELIRLYGLQKQFFEKTNAYTSDLQSKYSVEIEFTKKQFLIYSNGKSGKTWYIDQESKIWSE